MTIFLGIGAPHGFDWIIIGGIFVLLFGAKKLPELARGIGKSMGEFKKAKQEFEQELNASMKEDAKPAPNATAAAPVQTSVPGTVSVAKGSTVASTSDIKNN